MKYARFAGIALILTVVGAGLLCPGPARADSPEDASAALIAESLALSARNLIHAPPDTPARAARLVALTQFARQYHPDNPLVQRILAEIYQSQNRLDLAAEALDRYLAAHPHDYAQHLRRLELGVEQLQTAEERIAYLAQRQADSALSAPVRTAAAVLRADFLQGRGDLPAARDAYQEALELDPASPRALQGLLALQDTLSAADRASAALGLLRTNPGSFATAMEAGTILGEMGLHAQAQRFLAHAAAVLRVPLSDPRAHPLLVRRADAMLDAGQTNEAIAFLDEALQQHRDSADLRSLLIEAYRSANRPADAARLVRDLETALRPVEPNEIASPAQGQQLAWFYLLTQPDARKAIAYARRAAELGDPNDPLTRRMLGVAEIRSGLTQTGIDRLQELVPRDAYAAAFLAERLFTLGRIEEGRDVITRAAHLPRNGPAYRRLRALATGADITLPPYEGAPEVLELAQAFPDAVLELGRAPEKYVRVSLQPARERARVGEPIEVDALLMNTADIALPLGDWGVLNPVMHPHVLVPSGSRTERFNDLPLVFWPAPRYLPPGERIPVRVRVDCGPLAAALARRPLSDLPLTVGGTLDPVKQGHAIFSALPKMDIAPTTVTRKGLLSDLDPNAPDQWTAQYDRMLGQLVFAIRRGETPQRVLAARQVGALLCFARELETRRATAPGPLQTHIGRGVLIRMMVEVLKDPSPAVRSEMLASLQPCDLHEDIVRWFASAIEDPSPLVRLRLVELLGASTLRGQTPVLEFLANDPDEHVRMVAKAFLAAR